jgi:hypothetical protein
MLLHRSVRTGSSIFANYSATGRSLAHGLCPLKRREKWRCCFSTQSNATLSTICRINFMYASWHPARTAYPQGRSSNANSLWWRISAQPTGVITIFQIHHRQRRLAAVLVRHFSLQPPSDSPFRGLFCHFEPNRKSPRSVITFARLRAISFVTIPHRPPPAPTLFREGIAAALERPWASA